jgi:hypothetical protein
MFAGFERNIIETVQSGEHVGWAKFIGKRKIKLGISPFSEPFSNHYYILPSEIEVNDGELVELHVGPKRIEVAELAKKSNLAKTYEEYYYVEDLDRPNLSLPKPVMTKDEFLHAISQNWRRADLDHLDKALALQLVSCPKSWLGPGGIGAQSFSVSSLKQPLNDLAWTLRGLLPGEFMRPNSVYEFDFINSTSKAEEFSSRRLAGEINEASFNYLKVVAPDPQFAPIQIPLVIQNSAMKSRHEILDDYVLDYLLTSLMRRPVVNDATIDVMEKNIKFIIEEIELENPMLNVPIDRNALNRLAMAVARMEQRDRLDEESFSESSNWFVEMYRTFSDLRSSIFVRSRRSWVTPRTSISYARANLGPNDIHVLTTMARISRENGVEDISLVALSESLKNQLTQYQITDSLDRLVQNGFVLGKENFTVFRRVVPKVSMDLLDGLDV